MLNKRKRVPVEEEFKRGDRVMVMESLQRSKKKSIGRGLYKYIGDVASMSECKKYCHIYWGNQHPPKERAGTISKKHYRSDQLMLVPHGHNEMAELLLQTFLAADR